MLILGELTDYSEYHFKYEEELIAKYKYEGYEAQKIEHGFFIKKLQKIAKKDFDNNQLDGLMEIVKFVADWVSGHILDSDMGYKEHLKSHGVN